MPLDNTGIGTVTPRVDEDFVHRLMQQPFSSNQWGGQQADNYGIGSSSSRLWDTMLNQPTISSAPQGDAKNSYSEMVKNIFTKYPGLKSFSNPDDYQVIDDNEQMNSQLRNHNTG